MKIFLKIKMEDGTVIELTEDEAIRLHGELAKFIHHPPPIYIDKYGEPSYSPTLPSFPHIVWTT